MTTYDQEDAVALTELLLGHTVTKVDEDRLLLDDETELTLVGNMGCGGCHDGEYDLVQLNGVDNIITKVELLNDPAESEGVYEIFVYADNEKINLARFEGGDGNEYYGTGYSITVTRP